MKLFKRYCLNCRNCSPDNGNFSPLENPPKRARKNFSYQETFLEEEPFHDPFVSNLRESLAIEFL